MKLLIIDDDYKLLNHNKEIIQTVITQKYPTVHCEFELCSQSNKAIEIIKNRPFDLIILDINMPKIDGFEILNHVSNEVKQTNVMILTQSTNHSLKAWETVACAFLVKPLTNTKFEKALSRLQYPIVENIIKVQCFGKFKIFYHQQVVEFKRTKSLELFAILVHYQGEVVSNEQLIQLLWGANSKEDTKKSYIRTIVSDITNTFKQLGFDDVIINTFGGYKINISRIKCDYFDYLESNLPLISLSYMNQYTWAQPMFDSINHIS